MMTSRCRVYNGGMLTDSDIWSRVFKSSWKELDPRSARAILRIGLTESDRKRIDRLSRRGREGNLSAAERAELESYVHVARVLAMMHSRARKFLKDEGALPARQKAS